MRRKHGKSHIEQRLADLKHESGMVQRDMKVLRKVLEHPGNAVPWKHLKSIDVQTDSETNEDKAPSEEAADSQKQSRLSEPSGSSAASDLFSWQQQRDAEVRSPRSKSRRSRARKPPRQKVDHRFASYLTSGGFSSAGYRREDRGAV